MVIGLERKSRGRCAAWFSVFLAGFSFTACGSGSDATHPASSGPEMGAIHGIVTASGVPLGGAQVTLAGLPFTGALAERTVTADTTAHFTFAGLTPGTYSLTATAPGFSCPSPVTGVQAGVIIRADISCADNGGETGGPPAPPPEGATGKIASSEMAGSWSWSCPGATRSLSSTDSRRPGPRTGEGWSFRDRAARTGPCLRLPHATTWVVEPTGAASPRSRIPVRTRPRACLEPRRYEGRLHPVLARPRPRLSGGRRRQRAAGAVVGDGSQPVVAVRSTDMVGGRHPYRLHLPGLSARLGIRHLRRAVEQSRRVLREFDFGLERRLSQADQRYLERFRSAWSPDGNRIAFTTNRSSPDGRSYIALISPNGSGSTRLEPGHRPAWSPDGTRIVSWAKRTRRGCTS